jgi:hypothetical protein
MAPPLSDRSDNDPYDVHRTLGPDLDAEPLTFALVFLGLVAALSGGLMWFLCWVRH